MWELGVYCIEHQKMHNSKCSLVILTFVDHVNHVDLDFFTSRLLAQLVSAEVNTPSGASGPTAV